MLNRRLLILVALGTLAGGVLSVARAADETVPADLSPFTDLVRKCEDFEKRTHPLKWGVVWSEEFNKDQADRWNALPANAPPAPVVGAPMRSIPAIKVSADTIDQRECAVLDSTGMSSPYQRYGPALQGDFAIEFVGQSIGDNIGELSILCNTISQGPGFLFGTANNTQNMLMYWEDQPIAKRMQLPNKLLIEKGRWYTVRLEVKDGMVRALVDGELLGEAKSAARPGRTYRATLYCRRSKIAVDSMRIESMIKTELPNQRDIDAAFAGIFKDQTPEQVNQQIAKLIEKLEDGKFPIRNGAAKMLRTIGSLAEPLLKEAAESGLPETSARATEILNDIHSPRGQATKPATRPTTSEPPVVPAQLERAPIPF